MALTPPTSPTSYALPTALVPRRDHPRAPPHRHPRKSLPVLRPRLPLLLRARAPSRPSSFNDQLAVPAVTRARRRARVGGCFGGCTVVRVESLHLRETGASVKAQHRRWRTIQRGGGGGCGGPMEHSSRSVASHRTRRENRITIENMITEMFLLPSSFLLPSFVCQTLHGTPSATNTTNTRQVTLLGNPLCRFLLIDDNEHGSSGNGDDIATDAAADHRRGSFSVEFEVHSRGKSFVLQAPSESEKRAWVEDLARVAAAVAYDCVEKRPSVGQKGRAAKPGRRRSSSGDTPPPATIGEYEHTGRKEGGGGGQELSKDVQTFTSTSTAKQGKGGRRCCRACKRVFPVLPGRTKFTAWCKVRNAGKCVRECARW